MVVLLLLLPCFHVLHQFLSNSKKASADSGQGWPCGAVLLLVLLLHQPVADAAAVNARAPTAPMHPTRLFPGIPILTKKRPQQP